MAFWNKKKKDVVAKPLTTGKVADKVSVKAGTKSMNTIQNRRKSALGMLDETTGRKKKVAKPTK